jgi:hypothetical protein
MEAPMSDIVRVPQPHVAGLSVTPYTDGRRVSVSVDLAGASAPCNLDVEIRTIAGRALGAMLVVELSDPHVELTIHYRGSLPKPGEELVANATLLIGEEPSHRASVAFCAVSPQP